jgi:hypothetical protein
MWDSRPISGRCRSLPTARPPLYTSTDTWNLLVYICCYIFYISSTIDSWDSLLCFSILVLHQSCFFLFSFFMPGTDGYVILQILIILRASKLHKRRRFSSRGWFFSL